MSYRLFPAQDRGYSSSFKFGSGLGKRDAIGMTSMEQVILTTKELSHLLTVEVLIETTQ